MSSISSLPPHSLIKVASQRSQCNKPCAPAIYNDTTMSSVQEELNNTQDMLQGYVELYNYSLSYVKTMAIGCAIQLGIPSAIHRRGGAATISDIITETGVDPSKLPYLRRLMRVLTVSSILATTGTDETETESDDSTVYKLTPASRLLVSGAGAPTSCDISPMLDLLMRPTTSVATYFSLEEWFKDAGATATLFEVAHGMSPWSLTKNDALYNKTLNDGCAADSNFAMDTLLREPRAAGIFRGLGSLVDVGGGHGAAAMAIARAFPHIRCSVLDLEQVVSGAPDDGTVKFIAGDMFESIPAADCVLLKVLPSVLHYYVYIYALPVYACISVCSALLGRRKQRQDPPAVQESDPCKRRRRESGDHEHGGRVRFVR